MSGIIPGFEYDIFISYRQKKEGENGRMGEVGIFMDKLHWVKTTAKPHDFSYTSN
jgi:hypothetical protein